MENRKQGIGVSVLVGISHIAGMVRVILTSLYFGSSASSDILSFTFSFSNSARKKIEDGTGNLALLTGEANYIFLIIIHAFYLLLAFLFSRPLIRIFLSFTHFSPEDFQEAEKLFFLFSIFIVLFSLASNFNAYIQKKGKLKLSSALIIMPSLFSILSMAMLHGKMGVFSFSSGLIWGTAAFLISSLISAVLLGLRIKVELPEKRFLRQYFASSLIILLSVVENVPFFAAASGIEKGSIYFANAFTAALLPYGFLIELFTIMDFNEIAKLGKEERNMHCRETVTLFSFLSLSVSILMHSFSSEISLFLFSGMSYSREDALYTGEILKILSIAIFFLFMFSLMQRIMFIEIRNRAAVFSVIIKIAVSYALLFILRSSIYKSSLMFLISSLISFIAALSLSGGERHLKGIWKSILSAIPLFILGIYKSFVIFESGKITMLFKSLALGLTVFSLSFLIFMKITKRPQRAAKGL